MSTAALKHLRKNEWTMGNGQCHACEACAPTKTWEKQCDYLGHERSCSLAKAIESLGGKVEWRRKNNSKARRDQIEWERTYYRSWFNSVDKLLDEHFPNRKKQP